MTELLLLSPSAISAAEVLPALQWLGHHVLVRPMATFSVTHLGPAQIILLDARQDLALARKTGQLLRTAQAPVALIFVLTEGGLLAVSPDWGGDDFLLTGASPAEVEARLRLARTHGTNESAADAPEELATGELFINASSYTARLRGAPLDLTYKEFELLKYLMAHPGRVFTRTQLLQEVWGYDYYGGTRTVDVHVRRLRAKLGVEYEQIIGTVRNVGYRFDPPGEKRALDTSIQPVEVSEEDRIPG
ncbi:response regulator transcription factor [Jonesiaceae bacterium BS-20]|uniref:Response regulator transcription factor n=1 Tax=Jonesiaceae bacterium BS-20 TaxID=3120821 RepID=A0AAU7DUS9_9MICO